MRKYFSKAFFVHCEISYGGEIFAEMVQTSFSLSDLHLLPVRIRNMPLCQRRHYTVIGHSLIKSVIFGIKTRKKNQVGRPHFANGSTLKCLLTRCDLPERHCQVLCIHFVFLTAGSESTQRLHNTR